MKLLSHAYVDINLIYLHNWELRKIIRIRNSFEKMGKEIPKHLDFFAKQAESELRDRGNSKRKILNGPDFFPKKMVMLFTENLKNFLVRYQMRRIIRNNLRKNRRLKK